MMSTEDLADVSFAFVRIADGWAPTRDEVNALVNVLGEHRWVTAFGMSAILIATALAIFLYIVLRPEANRSLISELLKNRSQERRERVAADEALRATISDFELSKLALSVASDTIERFSLIRFDSDPSLWRDAHSYLLDWLQRLFGFSKSDVNKVTVWYSHDGLELLPLFWNGMTPEAARRLRLSIYPKAGESDTFAAMAYRGAAVFVCDDIESDARYQELAQKPRHPYRSLIAAPVFTSGRVVAVLTVDSLLQGAFADKDSQRLAKLGAALVALLLQGPTSARETAPSQSVTPPKPRALES